MYTIDNFQRPNPFLPDIAIDIWLLSRYSNPMRADVRAASAKWHGEQQVKKASCAEVFEICEYGIQPNEEIIRRLFPMLIKK